MPIRVSTIDGTLLDVVSLVHGSLEYQTGEAEDLFATKQFASGLSDSDMYKCMQGWSNGYITAKEGKASWIEKAAM